MLPETDHHEIRKLLEGNKKLLEENNRLLKKIRRNAIWGFWIRIFWYLLLIGLPFAFYFYILDPYFTALGSSYDTFKEGVSEIPGLKGLGQLLNSLGGRSY